jgi:glycosyltransferase involved in cell wall biosynthesis
MRLYVPGLGKQRGGPASFLRYLVSALARRGVRASGSRFLGRTDVGLVNAVCDDRALGFLRRRGVPIVQRLDGIHFGHLAYLNERTREVYELADTVIFQSQFSQALIRAHFGAATRTRIVLNATDLSVFVPAAEVITPRPLRLIASAHWRSHKRLRDGLEVFLAVRRMFPEATLTVVGDTSAVPREAVTVPGAVYIGEISHDRLAALLRESRIFLHPSWVDPCPNAVVEALACGLPVIYGRNGGTRELVPPGCGIELRREREFDYFKRDLRDYDLIPRLDCEEAAEAVRHVVEHYAEYRATVLRHRAMFGIDRAADLYADVFNDCVHRRSQTVASGRMR